MKITIDTSNDSHDEIRKVVKLLNHLVGDGETVYTNKPERQSDMFSDTSEEQSEDSSSSSDDGSSGGLFSMFGDASDKQTAKDNIANEVFGESQDARQKPDDLEPEEPQAEDVEVVPYD
tara:strand:- start:1800 stop:2156 length:357 start_codon:yes stop_codon:yes gene_type:complete